MSREHARLGCQNASAPFRSAFLGHTDAEGLPEASIVSYEHLDPSELVAARAQQRRGLAAYLKSATSALPKLC